MLTSSVITIVSFTLKVSLSREHPTRNDVKKLLHDIRGLFVKLWPTTYNPDILLVRPTKTSNADNAYYFITGVR